MKPICFALAAVLCLTPFACAAESQVDPQTQVQLDKIGTWDGKTASAKLEGPYETGTAIPGFGILGYWNQPWRAYMDTWPATRLTQGFGINWNIDAKYAEPMAQLLEESGIRTVRYEIGWGHSNWDDKLPPEAEASMRLVFAAFKRHGIRPMILLNAHHGQPVPVRNAPVEVVTDAQKGARILKLKAGTQLRGGYVGLRDPRYIAGYPLVTKVDDDGTAHLSAPLEADVKAGPLSMIELKYQPFQGMKLKDGTVPPAAQETIDGWMKFVAAVGAFARDALATPNQAGAQVQDSGFDVEVWNELTFGSNFLDINNYYDPKREYAEPMSYSKQRPWRPGLMPDAKTDFSVTGYYALLGRTVDYFTDPKNGYVGVRVDDGFANQTPFPSGSAAWPGQGALSRHYYSGGQGIVSPQKPAGSSKQGGLDALGKFDGEPGDAWWQVKAGTNFVPTFFNNYPEFWHSGFKTETASRDLIPDSRLSGMPGHGRFTHNGDLQPPEIWQTEVEYDRAAFFNSLMEKSGAKKDDPRLLALDTHMAGKMMLRQYLFHIGKGFDRIYIFALSPNPLNYGPMPQAVYDALDKSDNKITPAVRAALPAHIKALMALKTQLQGSEIMSATRPLRIEELTEYKPRLLFAGDGTPAHPSRYNRDQFAFLPFQQTAGKFLIPYYVVTLNVEQAWDKNKDLLDPARYDMPEQEFEVGIGNIAGKGAKVSAYDPLTGTAVPVEVVEATGTTMKVRLRTTDYPRMLQIEEAKPGVQILEPKIAVEKNGVRISWKTNIPVGAARLTYGSTWQTRGANDVVLDAANKKDFSVLLPANGDFMAVRIRVAAAGLSTVWPRWDEDPQGQISLRGQAVSSAALAKPMTPRASEDFTNALGQYEATVLPQESKPAWPLVEGTTAGALQIANGVLSIDSSADLTQKAAFSQNGLGLNGERGFTIEANVQISNYTGGGVGNDVGFMFQVFGDKDLLQVDLSNRQIIVRGGQSHDFNFADKMHVLRLVKHGGESLYDVYIDGQAVERNVPTVAAGADRITWGDVSTVRGLSGKLDYLRVDNTGAWLPGEKIATTALTPPAGISLPVQDVNAPRAYTIFLPAGTKPSGESDDRSHVVGGVNLRVRYLSGAAGNLDAYLPSTSVTDTINRKRVTLPGGTSGELVIYELAAVAHPGMNNLSQRYLAIKRGGDLLLLSASGAPEAISAQVKTLDAVFASVKIN